MDESTATKDIHEVHTHTELGFVSTYIFSTDHKMIAKQFLILGLLMMILGGGLALMVRWQLGYPEQPLPLIGVSQEFLETDEPQTAIDSIWQQWDEEGTENWLVENMPYGVMTAAFYNMLFTMHATIMIFFVIMPILVGCFGNFLIPLMLGARDMAFPKLNMLSFWVGAVSAIVMLAGFFVSGGHAATGWTAYAPLSSDPTWTGVDWGQNLWCISIIILAISSMMGAINYITTVINMRAPGMTFMRMPLVIWSLFIVAILLLLALPVLTSALALLLFDRMAGTSFFSPAGGGLCADSPGHGDYIGHTVRLLSQAGFRLYSHGICHARYRFPRMGRLGSPYVHEWDESRTWHGLHAIDHGNCRAVGDQDVQLAWHSLGRFHPFHNTDAKRAGIRVDVCDWRIEWYSHGYYAGGYIYPRYLLHRCAYPLRSLWWKYLRNVCRSSFLVPKDVRASAERKFGKDSLLADLYLLQLYFHPDAHSWRGWTHAKNL